MTEPTKRPWATIPELPNDIYQKIPDGYAYLGEFYEGEDNIGSAAANAALVVRAVNVYDEAKEALRMSKEIIHAEFCTSSFCCRGCAELTQLLKKMT